MAVSSDCPRRIGKAPTRDRSHPRQGRSNSSTLATYCIGRRHGSVRGDHERIEEAPVVGGDDQPAPDPAQVLAAGPREAQPDEEGGLKDQASQQVEKPVDSVFARIGVVALEALLADHLVRARGRGAGLGLNHTDAYTRRPAALLRYTLGPGRYDRLQARVRYQAASQQLVELLSAGRVRGVPKLRSGEDRVERSSQPAMVGAELAQLPRAAAEGLDPLTDPGARPFPVPRPATRSPRGPARRIASMVSGRRIALVSACGVSSTRTSVWQTTW